VVCQKVHGSDDMRRWIVLLVLCDNGGNGDEPEYLFESDRAVRKYVKEYLTSPTGIDVDCKFIEQSE
jgi:hypothetical protein